MVQGGVYGATDKGINGAGGSIGVTDRVIDGAEWSIWCQR
jgi:hypothetical protein